MRGKDPVLTHGYSLIQLGRWVEAEVSFAKYLAENPDDGFARAHRALCLHKLGKQEDARKEVQLAIVSSPHEPYCHTVLAWVLISEKKWRTAQKSAAESLRLNPDYVEGHIQMAHIYWALGQRLSALEETKIALSLNPNSTRAHQARAAFLQTMGRTSEASESLQKVLAQSPEKSSAHVLKGWNLLRQGKPREALPAFLEALRLDPNSEDARKGALEALRARYPFYRVGLGMAFALGRLPQGARLGAFFLVYLALHAYDYAQGEHLAYAVLLLPISILAGFILLMTYFGRTLTNGLLLLSPMGRKILIKGERMRLTIFWLGALAALACIGIGLAVHQPLFYIAATVLGLVAACSLLLNSVDWNVRSRRTVVWVGIWSLIAAIAIAVLLSMAVRSP